MATFGDMVSDIEDMIARPDLTAQVKRCILDAIEHYENQWFWFKPSRFAVSTVVGQTEYDMGLTQYSSVYVTTGDWQQVLSYATPEWMQRNTYNGGTGEPIYWSSASGKLLIYPQPDKVYPLVVIGQGPLPKLVNYADSNVWTNEARRLITARAMARLYTRYIRDMNEATVHAAEEAEAYKNLTAKNFTIAAPEANVCIPWGL